MSSDLWIVILDRNERSSCIFMEHVPPCILHNAERPVSFFFLSLLPSFFYEARLPFLGRKKFGLRRKNVKNVPAALALALPLHRGLRTFFKVLYRYFSERSQNTFFSSP